jgi:hypothetical protein
MSSDAPVGPVLAATPTGRAIAGAISEHNPTASVIDRGSYLRVTAPGRCAVTREAIEAHLGAAFELPGDLERVMPSFEGTLTLTEEDVTWSRES